jgi:hypothetical protein
MWLLEMHEEAACRAYFCCIITWCSVIEMTGRGCVQDERRCIGCELMLLSFLLLFCIPIVMCASRDDGTGLRGTEADVLPVSMMQVLRLYFLLFLMLVLHIDRIVCFSSFFGFMVEAVAEVGESSSSVSRNSNFGTRC